MVKIKDVLSKIKSDIEYIDTVQFGDYENGNCMCIIAFKSLCENKSPWNKLLINSLNDYILGFDALIDPLSTKNNISIILTVKL